MSNVRPHVNTPALPADIARAMEPLLIRLVALGFSPVLTSQSPSFGDFEVTFTHAATSFSVVRDRGQFHVGRFDRSVLEAAGLCRSSAVFSRSLTPLLSWLERQRAV